MAAFIDEDMNILHIDTFVWYACIVNVASLEKLKDHAHVLRFVYYMFFSSAVDATILLSQLELGVFSLITVCFGVDPPA